MEEEFNRMGPESRRNQQPELNNLTKPHPSNELVAHGQLHEVGATGGSSNRIPGEKPGELWNTEFITSVAEFNSLSTPEAKSIARTLASRHDEAHDSSMLRSDYQRVERLAEEGKIWPSDKEMLLSRINSKLRQIEAARQAGDNAGVDRLSEEMRMLRETLQDRFSEFDTSMKAFNNNLTEVYNRNNADEITDTREIIEAANNYVRNMGAVNQRQADAMAQIAAQFGERIPRFVEQSRWVDMEYRQEFYQQFTPQNEPRFSQEVGVKERRVLEHKWMLARICFYKKAFNAMPEKLKESQDVGRFSNEMIWEIAEQVEGTKEMLNSYIGEVLNKDSEFWQLIKDKKMTSTRFDRYRERMRQQFRSEIVIRSSDPEAVLNMLRGDRRSWSDFTNSIANDVIRSSSSESVFNMLRGNRRVWSELDRSMSPQQRNMSENELLTRFRPNQIEIIRRGLNQRQIESLINSLPQDSDFDPEETEELPILTKDGLLRQLNLDQVQLIKNSLTQGQIDMLWEDFPNREELSRKGATAEEWLQLKLKEADTAAWNAVYASSLVEWANSRYTISGDRYTLGLHLGSGDYTAVFHKQEHFESKIKGGRTDYNAFSDWGAAQMQRIHEEVFRRTGLRIQASKFKVERADLNNHRDFWRHRVEGSGRDTLVRVKVPEIMPVSISNSFLHDTKVVVKEVEEMGRGLLGRREARWNGKWKVDINGFRNFIPESDTEPENEHPFSGWVFTNFGKAISFNELCDGKLKLEWRGNTGMRVAVRDWAKKVADVINAFRPQEDIKEVRERNLTNQTLPVLKEYILRASTGGMYRPNSPEPTWELKNLDLDRAAVQSILRNQTQFYTAGEEEHSAFIRR